MSEDSYIGRQGDDVCCEAIRILMEHRETFGLRPMFDQLHNWRISDGSLDIGFESLEVTEQWCSVLRTGGGPVIGAVIECFIGAISGTSNIVFGSDVWKLGIYYRVPFNPGGRHDFSMKQHAQVTANRFKVAPTINDRVRDQIDDILTESDEVTDGEDKE